MVAWNPKARIQRVRVAVTEHTTPAALEAALKAIGAWEWPTAVLEGDDISGTIIFPEAEE